MPTSYTSGKQKHTRKSAFSFGLVFPHSEQAYRDGHFAPAIKGQRGSSNSSNRKINHPQSSKEARGAAKKSPRLNSQVQKRIRNGGRNTASANPAPNFRGG